MTDSQTQAWKLYEAGKEYNRRIGLYETVRRNERFYRGDQWQGSSPDLPHPVFNLTRRITDFLIGSVAPGDLSIHYTDDRLPFLDTASTRSTVTEGIALLNKNASYRWKQNHMDALAHRALLDAAISGDGIFYCWWDSSCNCGQPFCGDIRTDLVNNTNFFVANPKSTDLQAQDYLLLAGRATVSSLRREAIDAGMSEEDAAKIAADSPDLGDESFLPETDDVERATYLIRFFRENGEVIFEKSTRNVLIRRSPTGMKYYPVAYFNWFPTRDSYHGTAPVSEIIPNQKYINSAYAMVMKHMSDTAFSKVVYDKSRIPEWSNEVGEAIAAVGGGNVADAVSVVGVGQLQENYLDLIESVIENTKAMMGATESALGDEKATNTSAILALQEASRISLTQIATRFCSCIGDLASIWADMLCAYCPPDRLITVSENGTVTAHRVDYKLLQKELLHATAEATSVSRYTPSATTSLLNHLLDGGYITVQQYLKYLPEGCISDRNALLQELSESIKNAERRERE